MRESWNWEESVVKYYKVWLLVIFMGKINVEWHEANKIGKTLDEKMIWRIEHMKHCDCRKPTEKMLREIAEWKKGSRNI